MAFRREVAGPRLFGVDAVRRGDVDQAPSPRLAKYKPRGIAGRLLGRHMHHTGCRCPGAIRARRLRAVGDRSVDCGSGRHRASIAAIRRTERRQPRVPWLVGRWPLSESRGRAAGERDVPSTGAEGAAGSLAGSLIDHVHRSPLSWWSGVRRWRATIRLVGGWLTWLIAAITLLVFYGWLLKGKWTGRRTTRLVRLRSSFPQSFSPWNGHNGRRNGARIIAASGTRVVLAAGRHRRRDLQLHCWTAVCAAALVYWLVVGPGDLSRDAVAATIVLSGVSQVWLFALAVWLIPNRRVMLTVASLAIGSRLDCDRGFTTWPRLESWQATAWAAAALLTELATLSIWAAYRRWLAADIDW